MLDADGGTRFLCQARPLQRDAKSFSATTMTKPQESIKLALGNLRQQYEDKGSAANSSLENAQMRVDYIHFLCKIILGFFEIYFEPFFLRSVLLFSRQWFQQPLKVACLQQVAHCSAESRVVRNS